MEITMTLKIKIPTIKDNSNKEHEKALNLMREIRTDMMEQGFLHFLDSLQTPPGSPFGFGQPSATAPVASPVVAAYPVTATPAASSVVTVPVAAVPVAIHKSGSSTPKAGISPKAAAVAKPKLKKSLSWNENLANIKFF